MNPNFPYYNAVDQIVHAEWSITKLARVELVRESIAQLWPDGHPTRFIHVAGTGGKGSTCRFLEMGLSQFGTAGANMSPHLLDYRERFSINGEFVGRDDVLDVWENRIQPHCVRMAMHNQNHAHTFPEVNILIALALFDKYQAQWAAIETSVGGRYDQTRALDVEATVLTNVGSDHAHALGRQQWQRALDKSGIARPHVPLFTSETDTYTLEIVASVCDSVGAPLYILEDSQVDALRINVEHMGQGSIPPESLLSAAYQRRNATLALMTLKHLFPHLDEPQTLTKFLNTRLLGRFWKVEEQVYADIAHNAEKISALAEEILERFGDTHKILIIGASGRRIPKDVFPALAKVANSIIITGASYKGQDPNKVHSEITSLTGETPTLVVAEPRQAFQIAKSMRKDDDVILLTGSTYMIEQVLNPDEYLRYIHATWGWRMETEVEATGTMQIQLPMSSSVR